MPVRGVVRAEHQRHAGIVADHAGGGAEVVHLADEAKLEGLHGHVLEHGAGLLLDRRFVEGDVVVNGAAVAHPGAGHHRERVHAHGAEGDHVGPQTARGERVVGIEHEHARRAKLARVGIRIGSAIRRKGRHGENGGRGGRGTHGRTRVFRAIPGIQGDETWVAMATIVLFYASALARIP